MAWHTPIVASGGEGIFWLIVTIFVIISQIAKASKKNAPPTQKQGLPDAGGSPEEELRDFLKRLSGGAEESQQQPPPPPPRPQRPLPPPPLPAPAARTTAGGQAGAQRIPSEPPAHHHRQKPRAEPLPAPVPQAVLTPAPAQMAPVTVAPVAPRVPSGYWRAIIVADLANRECQREAIILRDILGPPLALRRRSTHAFIG